MNYIYENKETIKLNLLTKVNYKNKKDTILFIVISFLLNDDYYNEEYKALKKITDKQEHTYIDNGAIYDILGNIKYFISKAYGGDNNEFVMLERIDEYNKILNDYFENNVKTLEKAI